ncbi:MAG: hypothetical protein ABSB19_06465 [Methylomonas sp.]|jgi:hypothetical protein
MSKLKSLSPGNRRKFLKMSALTFGGLALLPLNTAFADAGAIRELQIGAKKYRSTAQGLILLSTDGGKNWRQIANFGANLRIDALSQDGYGAVKAHISKNNNAFWVRTVNDSTWLTAGYTKPV